MRCFNREINEYKLDGGWVGDDLRLLDNSTGILQSGIIEDSTISENSTLEINNGTIKELLVVWDEAQVVVNGGDIGFDPSSSYRRGIIATENTLVTINGGSIKGLLIRKRK
jgi:hypothetical protein